MYSQEAVSTVKGGVLFTLGATNITWFLVGPTAAMSTMVWLLFALVLHLSLVSGR